MQAAYIAAVLQKAAQAPALVGIYIKSVSICAVRELSCNPVLTVTWSMPDPSAAVASAAVGLPRISESIICRPSDTAMLLPRGLANPAEIEDAAIGAAWSLGAWDLRRIESAPLADDADWREARYGITSSFGRNAYIIAGQPIVAGDAAPDGDCVIAARDGYIAWRFVPLALSTPTARGRWADKDRTLLPDCTRSGEPGGYRGKWMHPAEPRTANEHQYQLGQARSPT